MQRGGKYTRIGMRCRHREEMLSAGMYCRWARGGWGVVVVVDMD